MTDGQEIRQDFENDLFGLVDGQPVGTKIVITKKGHYDANGIYKPETIINTRALISTTQPTNPYMTAFTGMDNMKNNNPNAIYIPYSAGEPREVDEVKYDDKYFHFTNVNPLYVGDDVVFYQCEMVRNLRVGEEL